MDLSVILCVRNQAPRFIRPSQRSIAGAVRFARDRGLRLETLALLDTDNTRAREYFARCGQEDLRVLGCGCPDGVMPLEAAVSSALGTWLAVVPAGGLVGETWFFKAFAEAERGRRRSLVFPEYVVLFGAMERISHLAGIPGSRYHPWDLFAADGHMPFMFLAPRSVMIQHPCYDDGACQDYGYGHRGWLCRIMDREGAFSFAPGTVVFSRVYPGNQVLSRLLAQSRTRMDVDWKRRNDHWRLVDAAERRTGKAAKNEGAVHAPLLSPLKRFLAHVSRVARRPKHVRSEKRCCLPDWLLEEWHNIHRADPAVFPESRLLDRPWEALFSDRGSSLAGLCSRMASLGGSGPGHVFLGPWLVTGGADKLTLNYIRAVAERGSSGGTVMVTTLNRHSPWASRLPAGVRLVPFGELCAHLSDMDQEDLLASLLFRWAPRIVHNINSELGFRVFAGHGRELSRRSRLYASAFCMDTSPEGHRVGYSVSCLPDCIDHLTAVISENQRHLDELADAFAPSPEKLVLHYQPVAIPPGSVRAVSRSEGEPLSVLWAGRFDRQKRPDLLVGIAEKSKGLPFRFHVYGRPLLNDDVNFAALSTLGNVSVHGEFDGLESLPLDRFDVLLYTAGWDGMPNILLESAAAGLPIIASDVGGIRELVEDGTSGLLVNPFEDVDAYIDRLLSVHRERTQLQRFSRNALERVRSRHSWETFVDRIKDIPGYAAV